jgi:hypothetical protein
VPSGAGRIRSIEKSNGLTGNPTRDLPPCSIMPQPTSLPRAPDYSNYRRKDAQNIQELYTQLRNILSPLCVCNTPYVDSTSEQMRRDLTNESYSSSNNTDEAKFKIRSGC